VEAEQYLVQLRNTGATPDVHAERLRLEPWARALAARRGREVLEVRQLAPGALAAGVSEGRVMSAANGRHANGPVTVPPPSADGVNGGGKDTATGRFVAGNKCGRGNPHFRKLAAARAAFLDAVGPQQVKRLAGRLYRPALGGDREAAKLVLAYACGRPAQGADPDAGALRALQLAARWPGAAEVLAQLLEHLDVDDALQRVRGVSNPATLRVLLSELAGEDPLGAGRGR
jgi:hypothetical protein